jgi:hypothetical protein
VEFLIPGVVEIVIPGVVEIVIPSAVEGSLSAPRSFDSLHSLRMTH